MEFSIPYGRQYITENDIQEVTKALRSDFLTQGPEIEKFENAFANYVGSKYAVAVSNGTAALHLSALSLNLQEGDKVITSPNTFSASANCIQYCGGEVLFADIDPDTFLISIDECRKLFESHPKGSIKGIIPVDFAGLSVDMEAFRKLADEFGVWLIEDACHAPGGQFENTNGTISKCGSSQFADLAIFSFHPVKHIATGEGGMITTNDESLYNKLGKLRTHGITKNKEELLENHGSWYYEMQDLGYNYRITDFQCALGISQLKRADEGFGKRQEIAKKYISSFKGTSIQFQNVPDGYVNAYHLFVILIGDRLGLYNFLKENGVHAQVHYIPVHLMPYYKNKGFKKGDMPLAESYYEKCLSLPMFPTLTNEEQEYVIQKVKEFVA